jgi:hypothetical protein
VQHDWPGLAQGRGYHPCGAVAALDPQQTRASPTPSRHCHHQNSTTTIEPHQVHLGIGCAGLNGQFDTHIGNIATRFHRELRCEAGRGHLA